VAGKRIRHRGAESTEHHQKTRFLVLSLCALCLCGKTLLGAALDACRQHLDRGRITEARRCYLDAGRATSDPRLLAEIYWKLGDKHKANDLFRAAVAAQPKDAERRVAWGRLFLEAYQKDEAAKLFKEALELDPRSAEAHLGAALVASGSFESAAVEQAKKALEINPKLSEAHTLLASLALEEDDAKAAGEHLGRALEGGGSPLQAYALKGAIDLLSGKNDSEWTAKALAHNPRYGEAWATPAHFFVITRRYRQAVDLYRRAIEIHPELWEAHAQLGVNLWRLGDEAGARRHLELAYSGDRFSAVTVNSLKLMDSMKRFQTHSTPRIILKLDEKEAELLRPYVEELLLKAIDTFSKKYNFAPERPVQLEVFPNHEDFAVRTMGMPGLGALGVTFGYVVAMDSPSARPPGGFHWGSTLWHELNHVFVLGMTGHKAPRWISEGLAVYEELAAGEGWGDRLTPDVIRAIKDKRLLPIAELDKGFVRPRYPSQVPVSYFQAGAVCEMIAQKWGFQKLLAMLRAYTEGKTTPQVVRQELGLEPAQFDEQFQAFLRPRTDKVVGSFEEWRKLMETAVKLARDKNFTALVEPARRARDLYPEYVEAGNPYELLAEALAERGDKAGAAKELEAYRLAGGHSPRALKKLAELEQELGRKDRASHVLEQLLWVWPGDEELHAKLGDALLGSNQPQRAAREFQALLALKPLDPAAAHYNLARAYHQMKNREKTREHLLSALETAPGYRPAQKLLLEINR